MPQSPFITPAARRHLRLLLAALRPRAAHLNRSFRALLRERPYDSGQISALLAITPAAATRLRTLESFRSQVEQQGRRLALLNLPLSEIGDLLSEFGDMLGREL